MLIFALYVISKTQNNVSSGYLLVFCRKDLCKANHEMQSVFKFSDVLFALKWDRPPIDEALGQVDIYCQIFGSGWHLVRCTPLVEASGGQEWYLVRSSWPELRSTPNRGIWWPRMVLCQVSLTFGQPLVRCTPWERHLLAKSGTKWGPFDLSSDVPSW